jgi:V8-like Glu-specific endopeptidase
MLQPMKECISEAPTGTAFLTADSKMITARHCVEYWIGRNLNLTTKVAELNKDDIIRWAIETETFNQTHQPDSMMQLRVFFSLYDFMGNKKYSFASTDSTVHINTNRDGVFMLADFRQNYYWRSVRPYFTDRQMELGDILWIEGLTEKGNITIAHKETMNKIKAGTPLMICGYPVTGIGDKRMMSTEGFIRRKALPDKENLFLESNINHGFSGGPVFMRHDDEIVAIGVISRVDSISSGLYKWAVPITEVDR